MRLASKRLILRDLEDKDARDISKNSHDKEVYYYTANIPYPYTLKNAKDWVKRCKKKQKEKPRNSYSFVIELKETGEVIGDIGLELDKKNKKGEIGYWIGKNYRKKGYVSEAEERMLKFAFNNLKLNKVYGEAMVDNLGSNKLFKKFGFRKIGTKKEEIIKNNKKLGINNHKKDTYIWELLKKDWKPCRKN